MRHGTKTASAANDRDKLQWSKDNITGQVTNYGYLAADGKTPTDRLTGITQTGGANPTNWAYTYDSTGNRTEAKATNVATGAVKSDQKLSFNAVGQITTTGYAYDGVGNMTTAPGATFTYNGAQQLTASTRDGVKTSYEYAGADMNKLLWQATDGGAAYGYTYGARLTSRYIDGTGTTSVITDPTTGQPLDLRTNDGTTTMWVLDGIGNPAAAIADTGRTAYTVTYDPYGGEKVTLGGDSVQWKQNPFGFKAGIRAGEANGLTKFGYRWQTGATGGWIQRDTLDAPLDPQNANRYAYAGDDPVNGSDPTGRAAYTAGVTGCYFLCLSGGVTWDDDGNVALTGGIGAGNPSFTGSFGATTGDVGTGYGASVSCSAGPASLSYGTSGDFSGSLGTSYSTGGCDGSVDGSVQIAG